MRMMTTLSEEEEIIKFVKDAAALLKFNPERRSFGTFDPGSLLAVRWGAGDDCIVVVRIDDDFTPRNYQQAIEKN